MAEDKTEKENEPPASKGKGPLLLILGVVGGLAVGGGAVYFLMPGAQDLPATETETATGEPAVAEHAAPVAPAVDLLLVQERRFAVPLINGEHKTLGYMWVDLAFEVDGPTRQSALATRMPELRDAFLRDLHARRTTREDRPGALDFDLLLERLGAATERVVGAEGYLAIRITNAQRMPE